MSWPKKILACLVIGIPVFAAVYYFTSAPAADYGFKMYARYFDSTDEAFSSQELIDNPHLEAASLAHNEMTILFANEACPQLYSAQETSGGDARAAKSELGHLRSRYAALAADYERKRQVPELDGLPADIAENQLPAEAPSFDQMLAELC